MSEIGSRSAERVERDDLLAAIADYVCNTGIESDLAFETAHYCLMDTLACGFQALDVPACTRLLGPVVPGATLAGGARVPGTSYELDPVIAAFNIGAMNRWLDSNETWLAAEWGHPSDNLGGILAIADYLGRQNRTAGKARPTMRDVLAAVVKAHEIQGVLALENGYKRVDLDHELRIRVASTAVITRMLGGDREQVLHAVANAWLDGGALRSCRHAPNAGSRKRWAAGDSTSRGVRLALIAMTGEQGQPVTAEHVDLSKGTIGNALQVFFKDASSTDRVAVEFPPGHRARRDAGIPALQQKFASSVAAKLNTRQWAELDALCADQGKLADTAVDDFMALLVV